MSTSEPRVFIDNDKPHGWRDDLLLLSEDQQQIRKPLKCVVCGFLPLHAVISDCDCGARYCKECIEHNQNITSERRCPKCGDTYEELFPDTSARKKIAVFRSRCVNFPDCDVEDTISSLNLHIFMCNHGKAYCPFGCQQIMKRSEFKQHERVCEKKIMTCEYCKRQVHELAMADHLDKSCEKRPVACEYCGTRVRREDLTAHLRSNHAEEYENSFAALNEQNSKQQNSAMEKIRKISQLSVEELQVAFHAVRSQLGYSRSQSSRETYDALLTMVADRTQMAPVYEMLSDSDANDIRQLDSQIQEFEERVKQVKTKVDVSADRLFQNEEREKDAADYLKFLMQKISDSKLNILQYKDKLVNVDKDVQYLELSSKDGVFIWKISNWSEVLEKARSSDPPFIVSPCFYTSPAGYRMRVRLFPNGDRDQRGRGLSLYMMIMRGPYDKMLRWPFDKQVIVSVVDQSDYPPVVQPSPGSPPQMPTERADYVCAIRPDLTKQSQIDACKMPRPDRESNPAIGFVRFIEHGDLTQPHMRTINQQPLLPASDRSQSTPQGVQVTPLYIKDNTIFIRVIVEPLDRAAMAER